MYLFFVMDLPQDGYISGRNMWEVYGVSNIIHTFICNYWCLYHI